MDREQAIRILSKETSLEAVAELEYYAGFDRDRVVTQIEEAMDMGADALRRLDRIEKELAKWKKLTERMADRTTNKRVVMHMRGKANGLEKAMEIIRRETNESETNELEAGEDKTEDRD